MSLTSHLADPKSPVRAWFDARLGDTAPLVKDANEHLRVRDALRADAPEVGPGADAKFCGTALDLLVRMTLRERGWSAAPSRGALRLQCTHGVERAVEIAGETADRIAALEPATRSAAEVDWGEVVPLCVLHARYEQAGRNEFAAGQVAGRLGGVQPTLAAHMAALVVAADVADLAAVAEQVAEDSADLRVAGPLLLGQTFALSGPLGGADADIIAGRTLIDLKGGASQRVIRGRDIHQLAGYALADVKDKHRLDTVSIHALRWRTRWSVSLQSLLDTLAGGPTDIQALRSEFAAAVGTRARVTGGRS